MGSSKRIVRLHVDGFCCIDWLGWLIIISDSIDPKQRRKLVNTNVYREFTFTRQLSNNLTCTQHFSLTLSNFSDHRRKNISQLFARQDLTLVWKFFFLFLWRKKSFRWEEKKGKRMCVRGSERSFFPTSSATMATHERDEKSPNAVASDGM